MKRKSIKQILEPCKSVVVIGSSPLLLLSAISLAKRGKRVTIISKSQCWGGSWGYTVHKGHYTDTACHLLESYKVVHDILNVCDLDLKPLSGNANPLKFILDYDTGKIKLFPYHSRISIAKELMSKVLGTSKQFIRLIAFPGRCKSCSLFIQSLSDLYLFFHYRFWQVLRFEPIHMPRDGWPAFLRSITDQVACYNIRVLDDSVATIKKNNSSLSLTTLGGLDLHADLVVAGQSTILQDCAHSSLGPSLGILRSQALKRYPHFQVEIIGLPAKLEIPNYIHLPRDPMLHRITTSFKSDSGYHCMLVQSRVYDIDAKELCRQVLHILNSILAKIYPDFSSDLEVLILDKYEPLSTDLEKYVSLNPGFYDGILMLRTIGDLSRNIVCYQNSLFTSK